MLRAALLKGKIRNKQVEKHQGSKSCSFSFGKSKVASEGAAGSPWGAADAK